MQSWFGQDDDDADGGKKERRATIISFPRGHYEIVQSNFT